MFGMESSMPQRMARRSPGSIGGNMGGAQGSPSQPLNRPNFNQSRAGGGYGLGGMIGNMRNAGSLGQGVNSNSAPPATPAQGIASPSPNFGGMVNAMRGPVMPPQEGGRYGNSNEPRMTNPIDPGMANYGGGRLAEPVMLNNPEAMNKLIAMKMAGGRNPVLFGGGSMPEGGSLGTINPAEERMRMEEAARNRKLFDPTGRFS